jgi:hypothetical protein
VHRVHSRVCGLGLLVELIMLQSCESIIVVALTSENLRLLNFTNGHT